MRQAIVRLIGRSTRRTWNAEWAQTRWDYLGAVDELAHYSVLAGYALRLKPGGVVLDVGCGEGLLRDRLHPSSFSEYVGLDFDEAISRATGRIDERTRFVVGDFRAFEPSTRFDTIVFNESLYYAWDPVGEVQRYTGFLRPGGIVLISMYVTARNEEIWAGLSRTFPVIDRVVVTNARGTQWTCAALARDW